MKKLNFIHALMTLAAPLLAQAASIMELTTTKTSASLFTNTSVTVPYVLTNNLPSESLSGFTINPSFGGGNAESMQVTNDSCTGLTIPPNASCSFDVVVSGASQPSNFTLSPRVCAFNGAACSQPTAAYRTSVQVTQSSFSSTAYLALDGGGSGGFNSVILPVFNLQPGIGIPAFNTSGFFAFAGLSVSPSKNQLAVPNYDDNTDTVLDISGSTPVVSYSITVDTINPSNPSSTAWANDIIYTTNSADGTVGINQGTNPGSVISVASGINIVATTPDGTKYFVATGPLGEIYGFEVGTNTPLTPPSVTLDISSCLTVSPDSSILYVCVRPTNQIHILSTADFSTLFPPITSTGVLATAVSTDGLRLFVSTATGVDVYDTRNYSLITSINLGNAPFALAVDSSDFYLYVTFHDTTLIAVNLNTYVAEPPITVPYPIINFGSSFAK